MHCRHLVFFRKHPIAREANNRSSENILVLHGSHFDKKAPSAVQQLSREHSDVHLKSSKLRSLMVSCNLEDYKHMIDPAFGLSVFGGCGLICYVVENRDVFPWLRKCRASPPGKAEIWISAESLHQTQLRASSITSGSRCAAFLHPGDENGISILFPWSS